MLLLAYSAANNDAGLGLGGLLLGAFVVGFIWLMVAAARWEVEHKHEYYYNGVTYSTKRAHRILGVVTDRIAEGHWIAVIRSVWRTNPDLKGEYHYFMLRIDEFNPPKISSAKSR